MVELISYLKSLNFNNIYVDIQNLFTYPMIRGKYITKL